MRLFDIFRKKAKPVDNKYVFDKAKYHDSTIEELGLDEEQSFVHTGLFLAWLVNNDLMSDFFISESGSKIEKVKKRKFSPSTIYMNWDGVLIGEMLSDKGFEFAMSYFDFEKGNYLKEYERIFCENGEELFAVSDTWDNYDKLRPMIDAAYEKWSKQNHRQ